MKKILLSTLLLSASIFAADISFSKGTLLTGVAVNPFSSLKNQPILIKSDDNKSIYMGETNPELSSSRVFVRLVKKCTDSKCEPVTGFLVDSDNINGLLAETTKSCSNDMQKSCHSKMTKGFISGFNKEIGHDSNHSIHKIQDYYNHSCMNSYPILTVKANRSVTVFEY